MRTKMMLAIAAVALAALVGTSLAVGAGEGQPIKGGSRNPAPDPTQAYGSETEIIANNGSYGTRQSNKSDNGGGAIYGCRSHAGGTPAHYEPCIRANNLSSGLAFEFETNGALGGTISAATPGDASKPFTTNATGVATGLNADRVDGKDAADVVTDSVAAVRTLTPFAQVAANGTAGQARGVEANGITRSATGNYDVVFTGDLSACALTATVTGTTPGEVTVTPTVAQDKRSTTVRVRTFAGDTGAPADRGFHIAASC
jgi:hypothetical protein